MTQDRKQSPAGFDSFGDHYHERLTECLHSFGGRDALYYNRLKSNILIKLASKRFPDLSKLTYLDLGCGTGLTDESVAPLFRRGVGVDLSMGMLKARTCRSNNCLFTRADATKLPFADATFDLVFSVTLMHHLPESALIGMFREIKRVLRRGGIMVHFDHNPYNFLTRKIVRECEYDEGTTLRPMKLIAEYALREGFTIGENGYLIFIPAALKFLEPIERALKPIPLGGQYFISARLD